MSMTEFLLVYAPITLRAVVTWLVSLKKRSGKSQIEYREAYLN